MLSMRAMAGSSLSFVAMCVGIGLLSWRLDCTLASLCGARLTTDADPIGMVCDVGHNVVVCRTMWLLNAR